MGMKKKTPEDYGINYYTWNPDGTLSVKGDVYLSARGLKALPFKFKDVSGAFDCSYNSLKSLEGAPQNVGGYFYCPANKLTSLKGAPQKVGGGFYCSSNKLTSLKGAPHTVSRYFDCSSNPREFTEKEIKAAMNPPSNTIPFIKSLEREFLKKKRSQ